MLRLYTRIPLEHDGGTHAAGEVAGDLAAETIGPEHHPAVTLVFDARAEYQVFLRFSELTAGRMAVLISHRFSTVRMADRILVLQGGELV